MFKRFSVLALLAIVALMVVACGGGEAQTVEVTRVVEVEVTRVVEVAAEAAEAPAPVMVEGDTLGIVRDRGVLKCGGNQNVPGFGYINPDTTEFEGFDIDFCKAVALAVLGDPEAVEIRHLTGNERFPVLQSGEIDLISRNTTWTFTRDTQLGADFQPTTFYDGQGMMVRKESGITELDGLAGGTVCVQSGTTTERNLADVFRALGIDFEAVVFEDAVAAREAYDSGQCDGFTTDKSGLVSQLPLLSDPTEHVILEATMSKEPLGPLTRHGDNNWGDIVMWTVNCTIQAEELGINQANVDDFLGGEDPVIQNLLGETGELGTFMGIDADFCYQIIKQVGNYEDIYNRNLGPDTPFDLERGLNSVWTDGGLLYSPPFR